MLTSSLPEGRENLSHNIHDDRIKWKHFPLYWSFVQAIHLSPVNSPHKGQWCRALMFSLICAWINGWVNIREVGDLRHHRTHYDVTLTYIIGQHWFRWWLLSPSLVPSHNTNQSWAIVNSWWPSDDLWCWKSWWTMVQVMACCLVAPGHYLNQCWLII